MASNTCPHCGQPVAALPEAAPRAAPTSPEQALLQELVNAAAELADFTHYALYQVARSPSGYVPPRQEVEAALRQFDALTQQLNAVQVDHDDPNERPHDATP